ncbi:putative amidohydrolase [Anseongella ginsenosidimutans]|uniref:Putative amidohydrolase n=1 Tax=Anseongella ginsenosidimutans TaxID=496056 RepID=A0A4R3KWI2_9SPHI|nr:carbon-nitrogen hydrolase family protein [Anseongella ginsenosidimutans]QEC51723.1 carbon-nitrogen hydrolase family protein [Anseongella ginsenosidimutans]TCS89086.1 putative amidohydrolase [Anseongella ginsenosidimutans]
MKIALASPPIPRSINEGLDWVEKLAQDAAKEQAAIICFPESFLPGYRGMGYRKEDRSPEKLRSALDKARKIAAGQSIGIILPMDWPHPLGFSNVAQVISEKGEPLGYQTKNQLDPSEDDFWIPGTERSIFEINGLKFGIVICHEGFRYPELVRWAARRDAKIVFHPYFTGSNKEGVPLTEWGNKDNPYYEKAMMMRALENTIYFASANYASLYPESASSVISPDGRCVAHAPYGKAGITVAEIDPELATGLLAKRFKEDLYR